MSLLQFEKASQNVLVNAHAAKLLGASAHAVMSQAQLNAASSAIPLRRTQL
jgi:hypothetical protein